jgi:hypothetical protein
LELWQFVYYAPIVSGVAAFAALVTAIVAWRTNVKSFRASFSPALRKGVFPRRRTGGQQDPVAACQPRSESLI